MVNFNYSLKKKLLPISATDESTPLSDVADWKSHSDAGKINATYLIQTGDTFTSFTSFWKFLKESWQLKHIQKELLRSSVTLSKSIEKSSQP